LQNASLATTMKIGMWRDTVPVRSRFANASSGIPVAVTIRFRPQHFPGRIMYHCHIASHSDFGMVAVGQAINQTYQPTSPSPTSDPIIDSASVGMLIGFFLLMVLIILIC